MNKKNVTISLGIATMVGISIVTQSNIDFAALSEQSAYNIIKNLGNSEISAKMGGLITDYSNYKKEKESIGKEDYKDYQDDALYIADLETDKAVVERIEKEIERENLEDKEGIPSTEAVEITPLEYIGEIPGPSNEKKSSDNYFSEEPSILTSSHYSSPVEINDIPSSESRNQNSTETVTVKTDTKKSEKKKTAEKPSVNNTVKVSGEADTNTAENKKTEEEKNSESDKKNLIETEKKDNSKDKAEDHNDIAKKDNTEKEKDRSELSVKEPAASSKDPVVEEDSQKSENKDLAADTEEASTNENTDSKEKETLPETAKPDNTDESLIEYNVIQDVYIRKDKDKLSENLGTLIKGEKISGVIDFGWLKFEYENQIAYVGLRFVEEAAPSEEEIRKTDNEIIETEDTEEIVLDTEENLKTEEKTDNTEIKETEISADAEKKTLLEDAAALKADSEFDMDFIKALYKNHFDIQLDSEAVDLESMGYQVSKENIKEGDLLFFEFENNEETVGIYTGNSKFIHISKVDGSIIESDIQSEDYNKTFVTARRILN